MSKTISIPDIEIDNFSKSHQANKELFESRLQLNSFKKPFNEPFSIKVHKSLEKKGGYLSISSKSKEMSFQKYFKIPKTNINKDKKRISDLTKNKVRLNLLKLSNKINDITNSLYINPKTANNSLINKKINNQKFINNNFSTIRNYGDKSHNKRTEIKMQKKNTDINRAKLKDLLKVNNNNIERDGLLSLNINKSSIKYKILTKYNKSGIIRTTYNNYNNKNKSRNIFIDNNLKKNSKEVFLKKSLQKNIVNSNKRYEISLNLHKDNAFNNIGQNLKKKFIFLNRNNKTIQAQPYINNNQNDKTSFIKNNNAKLKNKSNKNKIYNFKKNILTIIYKLIMLI